MCLSIVLWSNNQDYSIIITLLNPKLETITFLRPERSRIATRLWWPLIVHPLKFRIVRACDPLVHQLSFGQNIAGLDRIDRYKPVAQPDSQDWKCLFLLLTTFDMLMECSWSFKVSRYIPDIRHYLTWIVW